MLGAIYVGLSGLEAYSKGLQTVSNNVANLNTLGYKASTTNFSDVFSHGGGSLTYSQGAQNEQAGGGVRFGTPQKDFRQGDLRQSENDLDLAVKGAGFLVLLDTDRTLYARTGQFNVSEDGYIVMQGTERRLAVLSESGQPVALNIDDKRTSNPAATTKVTFAENLSSTGATATVSNVSVYDSNGGKQVWQIKLTAVGSTAPGEWTLEVTDQTSRVVGTSTVKLAGGAVDPSTSLITIADTPSGAAPLSVVLDFTKVTGFSSGTSSTLRASATDGNGVGALASVTTTEDGKVKLGYSNGKSETLGSVALADFRSPQSLEQVGNGLFADKSGGQHRLLASGTDGIGTLVSRQLEASNVDLSQEFGNLILIQRGFQASSQVVSVTNDMIQQLFGMRGQG